MSKVNVIQSSEKDTTYIETLLFTAKNTCTLVSDSGYCWEHLDCKLQVVNRQYLCFFFMVCLLQSLSFSHSSTLSHTIAMQGTEKLIGSNLGVQCLVQGHMDIWGSWSQDSNPVVIGWPVQLAKPTGSKI